MSSKHKCAVSSCNSQSNKLFRCPQSRSHLKKWKSILGVSEKDFYVCELHFDAHFISYEKILSDEAVPTIFINDKFSANQFCACCMNPISEVHPIGQLHLEIYRILFCNMTLNGDCLCSNCNDKMIEISDFIKIVEDNRRNFEFLEINQPEIKMEPQDFEVLYHEDDMQIDDILFIKSERNKIEMDEQIQSDEELNQSDDEYPKSERRKISKGTKSSEYKCEICSASFNKRKEISNHVFSVHSCDQNNKIFHQFNILTKPTECDICKELFTDKNQLVDHFKAHFDSDKLCSCPYCDEIFEGIIDLSAHKSLNHKNYKFHCLCYRTFNNEEEMIKCRDSHRITLDSQYWCDECPSYIGYESLLMLANHKTSKHGNGIKFWCVVCGKVHPSERIRINCKRSHFNYQKSKIQCPDCDKKIKYYTYKSHFLSIHSKKRDLMCEICGKGFALSSSLQSHIKLIHDRITYECDLCGYTCWVKHNMKKHLIIRHNPTTTKADDIRCPFCLKIFAVNLELHIQKNHPNNYDSGVRVNTETNKYHCPNCVQTFKSLHHYHKHVGSNICSNFEKYEVEDNKKLTTSTIGRYTCNICKAVKPTLIKLRRHITTFHSGQKTCLICSKTPKNLKQFHKHVNSFHKLTMKEYKAKAAELGHVL